jgi:hypothetical protein
MIAGPAPLEGLEIWIGGQGYELFHEAMTVTQGAVFIRIFHYSLEEHHQAYLCLAVGQIRLLAFFRNG